MIKIVDLDMIKQKKKTKLQKNPNCLTFLSYTNIHIRLYLTVFLILYLQI